MVTEDTRNPARRPQRLYHRREIVGMPKAKEALKNTAWKVLSEDKKATVTKAVRAELGRIIDRDMDSYPTNQPIDYQPIVDEAIRAAFMKHLETFVIESHDEPVLEELLHYDG